MDRAYIKLWSILGGEEGDVEAIQDVDMQAPSNSKSGRPATGVSRGVSPVNRVKRGLESRKSASVRASDSVDEVRAMREVSK